MNAQDALEKSNIKMNAIGSLVDEVIEQINNYIEATEFTHTHQFNVKFTVDQFGVNEIQQQLTQQGLIELGYEVTYIPISTLDTSSFWGYIVSWEKSVLV